KLTSAEFIYEEALYPQAQYTFKHALTQEVAYNSLLIERRPALHERVAEAIAAVYEGRLEEHYGDLARHYACSANREKAVPYLTLAGSYAASRSAHSEAIAYFTKALELGEGYADDSRRLAQELPVLIGLGASLKTTKGYAAAEVEHVYERAL